VQEKIMAKQTTRRGFGREAISKPNLSRSTVEISPKATVDTIQPITLSPVASQHNPLPPVYMAEHSSSFSHVTQIRIDAHLFDGIQNAVESAIFGGDYSIESASHFIREAMREHAAGVPLKVAHENGSKKSLSIRIDEQLKSFWDKLPKRHRNNILERAVRTKLLAYQN
jgi:hypothetical protein